MLLPRFDYKCDACGVVTEVRHHRDDAPTVPCALCAAPMHKLPSFVPLSYSGSTAFFGQSQQYPKAGARTDSRQTTGGAGTTAGAMGATGAGR